VADELCNLCHQPDCDGVHKGELGVIASRDVDTDMVVVHVGPVPFKDLRTAMKAAAVTLGLEYVADQLIDSLVAEERERIAGTN
jgi:hypothetical protein